MSDHDTLYIGLVLFPGLTLLDLTGPFEVLAVRVAGEEVARKIQLMIEYDPQPLFSSGSPACAHPALTTSVSARLDSLYERRRAHIERIVASSSLPR